MAPLARLALVALLYATSAAAAPQPYWVRIVDAQTGRGVPLVKVGTPGGDRWTDSGGVVVLDAAELQGRTVPVTMESAGYMFEAGVGGATLNVRAGTHAELKMRRLNIAERLYRTTGANIYGDTVKAGLKAPIANPLINARVTGQDTIIMTPYAGKLFWCWGDTDGEPFADGKKRFNGKVSCATSDPPGKGGLDPAVGIDFTYFKREDGFTRNMVPIPGKALVWIEGLFTARDPAGRERLLATYTIQAGQSKPFESGIVQYDDAKGVFATVAKFPVRPRHTSSHPFRATIGGTKYLYLFPVQRVADDWKSILDPDAHESWTCLKPGATLDMADPAIERDAAGKPVCGWKRGADWVPADRERALVDRGVIDPSNARFPLVNTDTGKPTGARVDSVAWNAYRKKWILLSKDQGTTYYSEATDPSGPFVAAKPVLTHLPYRLYNVAHHPVLNADGGRTIYLEGTFTEKLSRTDVAVPDYHYNNIMYRLDLSDPRLRVAWAK